MMKRGVDIMARGPIDQNAKLALNNYKAEIANELGINNPTAPTSVINNKGNVSMTKRMVRMGEGRLTKKRMD